MAMKLSQLEALFLFFVARGSSMPQKNKFSMYTCFFAVNIPWEGSINT